MTAVLMLVLALVAAGCGGGGAGGEGGGSESTDTSAQATTPIDLPPGQTSATLGWEPSAGDVDGYLVFISRNREGYRFVGKRPKPKTTVVGKPGDEIRIVVSATGNDGLTSPTSPPSPIIRFHAALEEPTVEAVVALASDAPLTAEPQTETDAKASSEGPTPESDPASEVEQAADETAEESDPEAAPPISQALLQQVLASGARLPQTGLTSDAHHWLQSTVDASLQAGLELAGTGHRDEDDQADLVWRDQAGQLFVSDGQALFDGAAPLETLEEALRLRATERFVALEDFDADGIGDWLLEDSVTGQVWIVDGGSGLESAAAAPVVAGEVSRLIGHGDFDGDQRIELAWVTEDRSILTSGPFGVSPGSDLAGASENQILAIADLDGDGRDDLLARDAISGGLRFALSSTSADPLRREWSAGPEATSDRLELVATLDLDGDGASELAWIDDGSLEIWDTSTGPVLE